MNRDQPGFDADADVPSPWERHRAARKIVLNIEYGQEGLRRATR